VLRKAFPHRSKKGRLCPRRVKTRIYRIAALSSGSSQLADMPVAGFSRAPDDTAHQTNNGRSLIAQEAAYDIGVCLARGYAGCARVVFLGNTRIGVIEQSAGEVWGVAAVRCRGGGSSRAKQMG
jgi:hypothetical protein